MELPTKAYYKFLFGESHGPDHSRSDPVSQAIKGDLREAPIYDFEPMPGKIAKDITPQDKREAKLNSDEEILLDLAVALQRGRDAFNEDPKLQWHSLGPVNESRFMQQATHAMGLYPSQPFYWNEPDARLGRLMRYFLNAYIQTRLYVKRHQDFTQAPRILQYYVK